MSGTGPLGGRIVRLCTDDDDEPPQQAAPDKLPFIAGDAMGNPRVTRIPKREDAMPKGHYDRSKSKPRGEAANDAPAAPRKAVKKAGSAALVPRVAKSKGDATGGRFDVSINLRGGAVTINAAGGSLTLLPDEVLALFGFLGRRG